MANQEALIAEYNTLREEMLQTMQMNLQFRGSALAVAAAFVVYGFQAQSSIAFTAAIVILVGALYYSAHTTKEVIELGAYIYALIEPKVKGLQWETIVVEMRKREKRNILSYRYPLAISIYTLLGLGCLFFTWWFLKNYFIINLIIYSCLTLILVISFVIISIYAIHYSSERYRSDCISRWKIIEKEIHDTTPSIKMSK